MLGLVLGLGITIFLFISGAPLFVSFISGSLILFAFYANLPAMTSASLGLESVYKYILTAGPLFILIGNFMNAFGLTEAYFRVGRAWVGHVRGGLVIVTTIVGVFFAAVCGGTVAAAIAIATMVAPEMRKAGYPQEFIACLTAAAGTLSILIPPSVSMIILGDVTGVSVSRMFIGGIIPGLLAAVLIMVAGLLVSSRMPQIEVVPRASWTERGRSVAYALPALTLPVIILGTIYAGIATPTESATIAAVAVVIVAIFYRKMTWQGALKSLKDTLTSSAAIYWVIMGAVIIGKVFAFMNIPQTITQTIMGLGMNQASFMVLFLVLFFVFGMVFDAFILYYVALPMLLPALNTLKIELLPFAILFVVIVMIGQLTPPVCVGLFSSLSVVPSDTGKAFRQIWPFVGALVVCAIILILWPDIVKVLPRLMPS